jgi:glycosyltransferase involved in cell wall biosynthesis
VFPFICNVKKVLILHQHFKTPQTGGAIRSYYLAKALVDRGIETMVITTHNEPNDRVEKIEGIQVHYLAIPYDNKFGFYKRSLSFIQYIVRSASLAGQVNDVDVCYAISVPLTVGVAAQWIKARYKIPYIFEVGDLWPDAPIQMGFVRNYFFKHFLYQLERSIYRGAIAIVVLSSMIQRVIEGKITGKTIHLIPNMADIEFYQPETKRPDLETKFGVTGKFVVSYIGALGIANGLDYFLECVRASQQANLPVHFLVAGEGAMSEYILQTAKKLQLRNLTFVGFVDRQGVRDVMNVTDASFISYKPVPVLETGSPNKYFDALAAGKLIVVNFGGWIKEEIEREGCGFYVAPGQPNEFVQRLTAFIKDSDSLVECQKRSRQLGEKKYSRAELGRVFTNLFFQR